MVYVCAQGRLASWKVTECNLVIHKLDMQAAADRESYTHARTYTTHKQASLFSHAVLYRKTIDSTFYCVSYMHPQIRAIIILHSRNQSHGAGPANMIWTYRTSECSNNFHVGLGGEYSEIMEPLPALSVLGSVHAPVDWLICEGYTGIDARAVSSAGEWFYLLVTTAHCSWGRVRSF